MSDELKPCPECGGLGFLEQQNSDDKLECPECSGSGKRAPSQGDSNV